MPSEARPSGSAYVEVRRGHPGWAWNAPYGRVFDPTLPDGRVSDQVPPRGRVCVSSIRHSEFRTPHSDRAPLRLAAKGRTCCLPSNADRVLGTEYRVLSSVLPADQLQYGGRNLVGNRQHLNRTLDQDLCQRQSRDFMGHVRVAQHRFRG